MAQSGAPAGSDPESPGQGTVRVEVGTTTYPTTKHDLPESIGDFEHHAARNHRTAMWVRRWVPGSHEDGYVKETYSVTCEGGAWHISRGVLLRGAQREYQKGIHERVLSVETVRDGFDSFEETMAQAERIMDAASRRTVAYPEDLPEQLVDAFEQLQEESQ